MASENNEVVGGKTLVEKQSEVVEAGIIEYKGEVGVGKELQETPECESGLGVRVWGVEGGPYKPVPGRRDPHELEQRLLGP
jgi:hypothetical protein